MALQVLLAVLLICVLSAYGVVGLWATKSQQHWFIRAMVAMGVLSPLLIADAYEPIVMLTGQLAIVAIGSRFSRRWRRLRVGAREGKPVDTRRGGWLRVSVADLLLTLAVFAAVLGVIVRLPELNVRAWVSMCWISIVSGLCILIADLASRRLIYFPLAMLSAALIATPLAWFDWFVPSLTSMAGWPPEDFPLLGNISLVKADRPLNIWFVICTGVTSTMFFFCALIRRCEAGRLAENGGTSNARRRARLGFGIAFVTISAFPIYVVWVLVRPVVPMNRTEGDVNAYPRIVALSKMIEKSEFADVEWVWDVADVSELSDALAGIHSELAELRAAVKERTTVPISRDENSLPMSTIMSLRSASRALAAQGRMEMLKGNVDEGCLVLLDAIRMGFSCRKGGFMVNGFVGIAITHEGCRELYEYRDKIDGAACEKAASELWELVEAADSYEAFAERDRLWVQLTGGWHGRLLQFLGESTGTRFVFTVDEEREQFLTEQAMMRLLAVELALRSYSHDHHCWPDELAELTPRYLPRVPVDPYADTMDGLRYARFGGDYVLYSVGANRRDDFGKPPDVDEGILSRRFVSGDFRLRECFESRE
ncbi:MAG: hypothetical protein R3E01_05075 [Pirellulaceae bacterium]